MILHSLPSLTLRQLLSLILIQYLPVLLPLSLLLPILLASPPLPPLPAFLGLILISLAMFGITSSVIYNFSSYEKYKHRWPLFFSSLHILLFSLPIFFISIPLIFPIVSLEKTLTPNLLLLTEGILVSLFAFPTKRKGAQGQDPRIAIFWVITFLFGMFLVSLYWAPHLK